MTAAARPRRAPGLTRGLRSAARQRPRVKPGAPLLRQPEPRP